MNRIDVCAVSDIPEGAALRVMVGDRPVAAEASIRRGPTLGDRPSRLADGCRLIDWIGAVPPAVGWGGLPTSRLAGAGKGPKPRLRPPWLRIPLGLSLPSRQIGAGIINPVQIPIWPLTILRLGGMPAAGKAPSYGPLSTGRSRHAIPGLALPFAVILTAHRLRSTLHPARQTARTWVNHSKSHGSPAWLW